MNKEKHITTLLTLLFIIGIFSMNLFITDKTFSKEERRYLVQRPDFTLQKVLDGSYNLEYENYFSDQFPMRNMWIAIKKEIDHLLGIDRD